MTPGKIQDPERVKTIVVSFKTAAGAITSIQRQTVRFVCLTDRVSGRLRIDMAATTGGKQNPALQGRRVLLIYKTHMHPEASLNPEACTPKSDVRARNSWIQVHIKCIDQYEDVYSPQLHEGDTYMEENTTHEEEAAPAYEGLPPSGTGHQSGNARE
jgi:hypothetical protein